MNRKETQVYETFIRTTPEMLWQALIDPAFTQKYFFGTLVKTTAKAGEPIVYTYPDGRLCVDGEILESNPPYKLVHTWVVHWNEALAKESSTITWLIEKREGVCKLTAIHELSEAPMVAKVVATEGWSKVLSGLKTLLETGEQLIIG